VNADRLSVEQDLDALDSQDTQHLLRDIGILAAHQLPTGSMIVTRLPKRR